MKKNKTEIFNEIISQIKIANQDGLISNDKSNERLNDILKIYDLKDNENILVDFFGQEQFDKIREYEQGMY